MAIIFDNLFIFNCRLLQQVTLLPGKREKRVTGTKKSASPEYVQPVEGDISKNVTREDGT